MNFNDYDLLHFLNTVPDALVILKDQYSIIIKEKDDRLLLKYHQIDTPKCHLTNQCRGVIISHEKPYTYICRGFYRFFNYGEYASNINWNTAKVQEKVDGSLIRMYKYKGQVCVATSGNIDAFDSTLNTPWITKGIDTYGALVEYITQGDTSYIKDGYTYFFELTSPYNRVVVPHNESTLTFITVMDNNTGEESFVCDTPFTSVKVFDFEVEMHNVIQMAEHLPFTEEGYVVVDNNFNRIKVKSPAYLAVHRLKGESSPTVRRITEMIETGETDEFLSYFPEYTDMFTTVHDAIHRYTQALDNAYGFVIANCIERKDIATVMGAYSGYIFSRIDNKVSTSREYLKGMPIKKKEDVITRYMEKANG